MRTHTVARNTCQASVSAQGASLWLLGGVAGTLACLVLLGMWTPRVAEAQIVEQIMDDLNWKKWGGCKERRGTEDYIIAYPDGKHAAEARECLAWDDIKNCQERERVEQFLKDFPGSIRVQEAKECLKRLGIGRQLAQCEWLVERNALTSGAYGNALDCYRKVLEDDPGNEQAQEGIAGIEEHYFQTAGQAIRDQRPEAAEAAIDRLRSISPEHPRTQRLAAELNNLKDALDREKQVAAARTKLREQVEALLAQGKLGEARSQLATARKQGLRDKTLKLLENRIEEAEAERQRVLEEKIAGVREALGREEVAEARRLLAEARARGLDGAGHARMEEAIREVEARLKDTAVRRLLDECKGHLSGGQVAQARDCSQRVLELEPGHAVAARIVRATETAMAWERAQDTNTVESYYRLEQEFPGTGYADVARSRLKEFEEAYWKQVQETGTVEAYRRYLEIYPEGQFRAKARQRVVEGG